MTQKKSLTICMPALNEEKRIGPYLKQVYDAAKETLDEFEIYVIDDGSTDNTSQVVNEVIKQCGPEIKPIRKEKNEGPGLAFQNTLDRAKFKYITGIGSDGAFPIEGVKKIFSVVGIAPMILGCRENLEKRPFIRYFLSRLVTYIARFLSNKQFDDVDGLLILPVQETRSLNLKLSKYNLAMEVVVRLLRVAPSFSSITVPYADDADKSSGMLRWEVVGSVALSLIKLFYLKFTGKL